MPQTTYRIEYDSIAIQTTDPETAERESRAGARVTASTVGVDA
jgi:hypothetical protein